MKYSRFTVAKVFGRKSKKRRVLTVKEINALIERQYEKNEEAFINQQSLDYHAGKIAFEDLWKPTENDIQMHEIELGLERLGGSDGNA